MNPFDTPPTTPPVSFDSPPEPPRSRGRLALVALAAAGLVGGGLVGVSQLVSADRPSVSDEASLAAIDPPGDDADDGTSEPSEPDAPEPDDGEVPQIDGEIVIDTGDGEPVVIDLGDQLDRLEECGIELPGAGAWLDIEDGAFPELEGKLGEFLDELELGDLEGTFHGEFGEFDGPFGGVFDIDGTHVTVAGPDGVSIVDLGDAGSVTITKDGDDVTVTTEGDATVDELPDIIELGPLGEDFDPGEFEEFFGEDFDPEAMLEEFFGEDFDPEAMLEEMFGEDFDPDEMFGEFGGGQLFELPADLEDCLNGLDDG